MKKISTLLLIAFICSQFFNSFPLYASESVSDLIEATGEANPTTPFRPNYRPPASEGFPGDTSTDFLYDQGVLTGAGIPEDEDEVLLGEIQFPPADTIFFDMKHSGNLSFLNAGVSLYIVNTSN